MTDEMAVIENGTEDDLESNRNIFSEVFVEECADSLEDINEAIIGNIKNELIDTLGIESEVCEMKKKKKKKKKKRKSLADLKKQKKNKIAKNVSFQKKNDAGAKKYVCHLCSRGNFNEIRLHRHVQQHFINDSNLCSCGLKFESRDNLVSHRQTCHNRVMTDEDKAALKKRLMEAAKISLDPLCTKNEKFTQKSTFDVSLSLDPLRTLKKKKNTKKKLTKRSRELQNNHYAKLYSKFKLKNFSIRLEKLSDVTIENFKNNRQSIPSDEGVVIGKKIDMSLVLRNKTTRNKVFKRYSDKHPKVCDCGRKFTSILKYEMHNKKDHMNAVTKEKSQLIHMVYEAIKKSNSTNINGKLQIFDPKMASLLKSGALDGGLLLSGVKLNSTDGTSVRIEFDGSDSLNREKTTESPLKRLLTYDPNVLRVTQLPYDSDDEYDAFNVRKNCFANTLKSTNCNVGNKIFRLGRLQPIKGPVLNRPKVLPPERNTVTIKKEENVSFVNNDFKLKSYRAIGANDFNDGRIVRAICSLSRVSPQDNIKAVKKKSNKTSAKKAKTRLIIQRITSNEAERRRLILKTSKVMFKSVIEERNKINVIESSQVLYDPVYNRYIVLQQ